MLVAELSIVLGSTMPNDASVQMLRSLGTASLCNWSLSVQSATL
jgi:hypothetical protein